jgi:hypothetical protein
MLPSLSQYKTLPCDAVAARAGLGASLVIWNSFVDPKR